MSKAVWIAVAAIGFVLILSYLPRAYLIYFRCPPYQNGPGQIDVNRRWQEVHYVIRRRNPYDVLFANVASAHAIEPAHQRTVVRNCEPFADLGVPEGVVYPPWAFPSQMAIFWMPRGPHLFFYAIVMAAGMACVALWSGAQLIDQGTLRATAIALAVAGCASWGNAVFVGNNPPIVVGGIVLCHWLLQKRLDWLAGLALGFAMLKPTLAAPFFVPILVGRRWPAVIAAALYLALTSLLTWKLTQTNPLEMLGQMSAASRRFFSEGFGPAQYMIRAGVSTQTATPVAAVVVMAIGLAAMWAARRSSMLALFALAAVTARLWTYHLGYDDAVLVIALVYLASQLKERASPLLAAAFSLLTLSLWLPERIGATPVTGLLHLAVWVFAGAVITIVARQGCDRAFN